MKALMISVHAKWCALIMNGEKTVEVRKGTALYKAIQKLIDEYGYADIYVYCTKGRGILGRILKKWTVFKPSKWVISRYNGKVIFKFRCYKVEEIMHYHGLSYFTKYENKKGSFASNCSELTNKSCLSIKDFNKYLGNNRGYAIHISDLEIFDRPKELSEFRVKCSPQSWCYCERE